MGFREAEFDFHAERFGEPVEAGANCDGVELRDCHEAWIVMLNWPRSPAPPVLQCGFCRRDNRDAGHHAGLSLPITVIVANCFMMCRYQRPDGLKGQANCQPCPAERSGPFKSWSAQIL